MFLKLRKEVKISFCLVQACYVTVDYHIILLFLNYGSNTLLSMNLTLFIFFIIFYKKAGPYPLCCTRSHYSFSFWAPRSVHICLCFMSLSNMNEWCGLGFGLIEDSF